MNEWINEAEVGNENEEYRVFFNLRKTYKALKFFGKMRWQFALELGLTDSV